MLILSLETFIGLTNNVDNYSFCTYSDKNTLLSLLVFNKFDLRSTVLLTTTRLNFYTSIHFFYCRFVPLTSYAFFYALKNLIINIFSLSCKNVFVLTYE
jgi:hypothetical protein